jgi:hypothetical protein
MKTFNFKELTKKEFEEIAANKGEMEFFLKILEFSCPDLIKIYENYKVTLLEKLSDVDLEKVSIAVARIYSNAEKKYSTEVVIDE